MSKQSSPNKDITKKEAPKKEDFVKEMSNNNSFSKSKEVDQKKNVKSKEVINKTEAVVKCKEPVVKDSYVTLKEATEDQTSMMNKQSAEDSIKELKARMEEEIAT